MHVQGPCALTSDGLPWQRHFNDESGTYAHIPVTAALLALVMDVILTSTRSAPVISTTAFLLFFSRLLGS
jgi:hypothetical protein